jgi:hypothetical protein
MKNATSSMLNFALRLNLVFREAKSSFWVNVRLGLGEDRMVWT